MSIFNNKPSPDQRPSTRLDVAPSDAAISVISNGMRVIGDIESSGVIKVDGVVDGAVRGARQLLLGKTGTIHGDIYAVDAVLGGTVVGTVITSERVEIQGTSTIEGDIHTRSIVVYEGAMINGAVRMGEGAAAVVPPGRASGQSSGPASDSRIHVLEDSD
jgi:cytoskeletal protein CcmA (bactofilin family)